MQDWVGVHAEVVAFIQGHFQADPCSGSQARATSNASWGQDPQIKVFDSRKLAAFGILQIAEVISTDDTLLSISASQLICIGLNSISPSGT